MFYMTDCVLPRIISRNFIVTDNAECGRIAIGEINNQTFVRKQIEFCICCDTKFI